MPEPIAIFLAGTSAVQAGDRFSRDHRFTPHQVAEFSLAAGDDNPLHLDATLAAGSSYGGLIASGTQTTALLLGLTASYFSKITSVVGRRFTVELKRAVRADAEVTIEWRVLTLSPRRSRPGQVVLLAGEMRDKANQEILLTSSGEVVIDV